MTSQLALHPNTKRRKNKTVLLAFFLGWIGAHRFYLGQRSEGLQCVAYSWTLLPWLISLYDTFYFDAMSNSRFDMLYNEGRADHCAGCNTRMGFMNTPNFGGFKLLGGYRICRFCAKKIVRTNPDFGMKSKVSYDKERVGRLLRGERDRPAKKSQSKADPKPQEHAKPTTSKTEPMVIPKPLEQSIPKVHPNQLNSLIGVKSVKEEIVKIENLIRVRVLRKEQGLSIPDTSYHMVFMGNPGTGKTTVARIVATSLRELGVLSKGNLIEVDRSHLVGEYLGHTAEKVKKLVNRAKGNVLFIDEAYSLHAKDDTYGQEAIATLIKLMEDYRDDLVVILAGYSQEMNALLKANPGFESRINRKITFTDYTADELLQIFQLFCQQNDYTLTVQAQRKLHQLMHQSYLNRNRTFGNGRFVRNLFETCIEHQSTRLSQLTNPSKTDLMQIEVEDIRL